MSKPSILIDTFGSHALGMGHVYRSLTLAGEIDGEGEICFRANPQKEVEGLFAKSKYKYEIGGNITRKINQGEVDILIIDKPTRVARINNDWTDKKCLLIGLDYYSDDADRLEVGINLNAIRSEAVSKKPKNYYYGLDYVIIKDEVLKYRPKRVSLNKKPKRVLIAFGSADPKGNTAKALRFIDAAGSGLKIAVVCGPAFRGEIRAPRGSKNYYAFYKGVEDIGRLMAWADFGICGAGTTMMEFLSLGKPVAVMPQNKAEEDFVSFFSARGAVEVLSPDRGLERIKCILEDQRLRESMAQRGWHMIDGKGKKRIIKIIFKHFCGK